MIILVLNSKTLANIGFCLLEWFVVHRGMFVDPQLFLALWPMYLQASYRRNPNIKDIATYYRPVESYCNEFDRVFHKTLLNIGFWEDATQVQKDKVVDHLNERYKNELGLFEETDKQVVEWVNRFWKEMIAKKTIDRKTMEEKHRLVKINNIKHKEVKEIGSEWICANTWHQLKLTELFKNIGWSKEKVQLAMTQVISMAV